MDILYVIMHYVILAPSQIGVYMYNLSQMLSLDYGSIPRVTIHVRYTLP